MKSGDFSLGCLFGPHDDKSWDIIEQFIDENPAEIYSEGQLIDSESKPEELETPTILGSIVAILGLIALILVIPFTALYAVLKFVFQLVVKKK